MPLNACFAASKTSGVSQPDTTEEQLSLWLPSALRQPSAIGYESGAYDGGAFVLVEQRPRRQSRTEVFSLAQGEALAFAVRDRPVQGARGPYRVQMKHGVATVTRGERLTLGIIFHDAL